MCSDSELLNCLSNVSIVDSNVSVYLTIYAPKSSFSQHSLGCSSLGCIPAVSPSNNT
nr:MAG TPA: hypothetical protein [Caudoviricetes sp.]DAL78822.1 MAG TPA: hypothetical protein [Caudoviricetes sp.]